MVDKILGALSALIVATIAMLGYSGVILMMAIESACIPLPSEVIMPFAGYLVSTGRFNLQLVAIAGAVGCLLGSYVAYFVGSWGGRGSGGFGGFDSGDGGFGGFGGGDSGGGGASSDW